MALHRLRNDISRNFQVIISARSIRRWHFGYYYINLEIIPAQNNFYFFRILYIEEKIYSF